MKSIGYRGGSSFSHSLSYYNDVWGSGFIPIPVISIWHKRGDCLEPWGGEWWCLTFRWRWGEDTCRPLETHPDHSTRLYISVHRPIPYFDVYISSGIAFGCLFSNICSVCSVFLSLYRIPSLCLFSTRFFIWKYGCGVGGIIREECREALQREISERVSERDHMREIYQYCCYFCSF